MTDIARSRRRWRLAFLLLLPLSLLSTGFLVYAGVDQSVTASYMEADSRDTHEDLAVLRALVPELSPTVSRSAVLTTLRRQHPKALITATDSTVGLGGLVFRFGRDGHLRVIEPLN